MNHASIAQITATHCCVCRAELTDAESVEHGIGPVCGRKYYNPLHQPTAQDVMNALGLLAISELPDHIVTGFLTLVNNDRANARKGCNLLVYWASAHYNDKTEVFRCSAIIRALGYTELAEKLEIDRTVALYYEKDGHLEAFLPDNYSLTGNMKKIPGAKPLVDSETGLNGHVTETRIKRGHKLGWFIPKVEEAHFLCALGVSLGSKLASGPQGVFNIQPRRWHELILLQTPAKTAIPDLDTNPIVQLGNMLGTAPTTETILVQDGRVEVVDDHCGWLRVTTPYNAQFVAELKGRIDYKQRKWEPQSKCWKVSSHCLREVFELLEGIFKVQIPVGAPQV